jgi:hypothetical protein
MAKSGIPLDEWSGSKATKELQAAIERIEEKNKWPQRWMLLLTAIAAVGAAIAAWPVVRDWFH